MRFTGKLPCSLSIAEPEKWPREGAPKGEVRPIHLQQRVHPRGGEVRGLREGPMGAAAAQVRAALLQQDAQPPERLRARLPSRGRHALLLQARVRAQGGDDELLRREEVGCEPPDVPE